MRTIQQIMALTISIGSILLSSCGGGDSLGGNVGDFKTTTVTAVADTPRLEADLITGNTCSSTGSAGGTLETESVGITVNTTATTSKPLPLSITGYTVSYLPKNAGTPALASITSNYTSPGITPGDSLSITIPVITDLQKRDLIINDPGLPCSLSIYQYDVTVSINVVEVGSGDGAKSIRAGFVMAIADRNN